ncbi:related to nuclear pore membrane protein POM152 [Cephalotrichum gorgonifer]|uniref:Related to nuclear pore membrane protein POM152 n=1 Tax=Cephalotrichum gorgonifer TaxID=2041049 RepID=A0AAE8MW63_9PEZI|nr:related to nuclear pore membrane protein POM152 [Cephalotrichum gorgonifer]
MATPRPRPGHFPQTPAQAPKPSPGSANSANGSAGRRERRSILPEAPEANPVQLGRPPVIPLATLDAPTQRLYVIAIYVALQGWKLYDWVHNAEHHEASFGLLLKWSFIDFAFLFGIPELRIPWLELSQPVVLTLYAVHFIFNYMLMFDVPLPFQAWLLAAGKAFFDEEVAVSEHRVRMSSILHNNSLIMGKQIINILPEGSAVLNQHDIPFCIEPGQSTVRIPIQFNGTMPVEIELLRIDLGSGEPEIIKLSKREIAAIAREMKNQLADSGSDATEGLYTVKKPGVYRLHKVLDEYKLEVQRTTRDTYVVPCPKASFRNLESSNRCINDVSDMYLDVEGTPPLKILYGRTINGMDNGFHFQSLQPDGFSSPLIGSGAVVSADDANDVSWVRPAKVRVPLNESLTTAGEWQYAINEVHDAFGNVVVYAPSQDELDPKPRPKHLVQDFVVNERPKARMKGCDPRNPLKVAKGRSAKLPLSISMAGPAREDTGYSVAWKFTPVDKLTNSGDHGDEPKLGKFEAKNSRESPPISEPGLYTLTSVTSDYCQGDVQEPSSCMLLNPLEPQLSIRAEDISDKCAGNAVGLRVDLDLMGTPPFVLRYDIITKSGTRHEFVDIKGLRHQLELRPKEAGLHKYVFSAIDDAVYKGQKLVGEGMTLEQDVKPAASAIIQHPTGATQACLDDDLEVDVMLLGDPPFSLEWEIVHDGRKKQSKVSDITDSTYKIKSAPFTKGGDYILALNSVQDKSGCRTFLKDELKISVRRQKPSAAFGFIKNKRSVMAVEKTKLDLPLRLQGEGPWTVTYRNRDVDGELEVKNLRDPNGLLPVRYAGVYEIVEVKDRQCRGTVDPDASVFEVGWEPRPDISLVPTHGVTGGDRVFAKNDVCEGDIDGVEINLSGRAPFHVEYEVRHSATSSSSASIQNKKLDVAQFKATIPLDTSKAGKYAYHFHSLSDNLYNNDRSFESLVLKQAVNPKPTASFAKPGQSFKYCISEGGKEDAIPITLTGKAPFFVELEIKHHSGAATDTYTIPAIDSKSYEIVIPRHHLKLGSQQVRIRTVRDSLGCQQTYNAGGPSVQVHLYDAPAIYPLDARTDYCVGERISYTLSGTPPFDIVYDFGGRRVAKSPTTSFRRVAESPGVFTITSVSDKASECAAAVNITKTIHPLPSVRISKGKLVQVDIHEGTEVEILFEFWGTPPFEFTYTRSTNAKRGQASAVLETRHDISYEHSKVVRAGLEGTYEVVSIKDRYCGFSNQQIERKDTKKIGI